MTLLVLFRLSIIWLGGLKMAWGLTLRRGLARHHAASFLTQCVANVMDDYRERYGLSQALRQICREAVAALSVLALVFLSFSQIPPGNQGDAFASELSQIAVVSFCGDGAAGDAHGLHGPCHACRVSLAMLPAPPCEAAPAFASFKTINLVREGDLAARLFPHEGYSSRAPPVPV